MVREIGRLDEELVDAGVRHKHKQTEDEACSRKAIDRQPASHRDQRIGEVLEQLAGLDIHSARAMRQRCGRDGHSAASAYPSLRPPRSFSRPGNATSSLASAMVRPAATLRSIDATTCGLDEYSVDEYGSSKIGSASCRERGCQYV